MPFFGGHGKPLHERTDRELVWGLMVAPTVIGVLIVAFAGRMIWLHYERFSVGEWFGVAWIAIVVPTLWIAFPAIARREQRRRRELAVRAAESEDSRS